MAQLLPSIVIGDSRTGQQPRRHQGGERAHQRLRPRARRRWTRAAATRSSRLQGAARSRLLAAGFPGDRHRGAEPGAGGPRGGGHPGRAHRRPRPSATASTWPPTTASAPRRWCASPARSWACNVRLADPTALPQPHPARGEGGARAGSGEPRLASALEKLGTIFGGYGEWGQPVHDVGNDVRILGLPIRRPDTAHAFRMLCRHNKYVQEFGRVRDPDEVARRERRLGAGDRRTIERRDRPRGGRRSRAARVPAAAGRRSIELRAFQARADAWSRAAARGRAHRREGSAP